MMKPSIIYRAVQQTKKKEINYFNGNYSDAVMNVNETKRAVGNRHRMHMKTERD